MVLWCHLTKNYIHLWHPERMTAFSEYLTNSQKLIYTVRQFVL